ncbi:UxaA family hydrolase [Snuella sedimenti]|uniref:UxaA family hydrolase n=1 Tax=Snuella sedimenti TaxID=2798802 RepID=A0A8J7IN23_9FLAO|nr:UxaA family hydrolase [Snuella sedimenti]MBJ6367692.1 UxaA family hydrolase [Snuella sedimenti]
MENSEHVIKLSDKDNVLVLTVNLNKEDSFKYNGIDYKIKKPIKLGDKIAAKDIYEGEKIIKFNMSIGSATQDIMAGEHVHLHNMKSDFIDSHTRES